MSRKRDLRQDAIDLRRAQVLASMTQGLEIREICNITKAGYSTVKRDISFMRRQQKENIRYFVEDQLLWEFKLAISQLDTINRKVWELSTKCSSNRESLEAFSLLKDISKDRLEILTHGEMLRQCLKVSEKNNRNLQRLEAKSKAKYKSSTNGAQVSKQAHDNVEREKVEFNESDPEAEKTTTSDTKSSEQSTHEIGDSNGP